MASEEEEEIRLLREELANLKWAAETYDQRRETRELNKEKKKYREKRKQYNDPYELDQYRAMKNETSKHPLMERDKWGSNTRPEKKPEVYQFNFPILRELRPPTADGKQMVFREWLLREYHVFDDSDGFVIAFHLELLPLCEEKLVLSVPDYDTALEILYRRCFNWKMN